MEIKVPSVGESIHEALLSRWLKKSGDRVEADEAVCEIETDKVTVEVNAEVSGVLRTTAAEGETVKIGQSIGRIEEQGETMHAADEKATPPGVALGGAREGGKRGVSPSDRRAVRDREAPPPELATGAAKTVPPAPPRQAAPQPQARPEPPQPSPEGDRRPMTPIRRAITERLLRAARETASLTTLNEADMTRVKELRERHREDFQAKYGVRLGMISFFIKACAEALQEFPEVNAAIDGNDIVYHSSCDIGVAVASPKGLVVPVLRGAQTLGFGELERRIRDFSERAQHNRLELADLEGGTFSITNGGVFGSLMSTPMLNYPQCAILGMHAVQERPVVRGGEIVIRPMMYLALTYDHRLIDGRQAVEFLKRVKELVEEPEELLLQV